jgi:hypothetical protein
VDSPHIPNRNFVKVRWRSLFRSTSLGKRCTSYNAPPTSRKRAADCWSLRNFLPRNSLFMVGKAQKSHGTRSGLYGGCSNGVPPVHFLQAEHGIQFKSRPMRFLGSSNHEKGAPRQEISKWSTVCSTFWRSGWSVVRSASLTKGGTSKKRPSLHLHKFRLRVTRWVHELCKRLLYIVTHVFTISTTLQGHNIWRERRKTRKMAARDKIGYADLLNERDTLSFRLLGILFY